MANETDELTVAITADTSRFQASLASLGKQSDSFASAITKAFKQAVVGGKDFGSVLSSLALQIAGMALSKALQPLTSLTADSRRCSALSGSPRAAWSPAARCGSSRPAAW